MSATATNEARLIVQPDHPPGPNAVPRRINVTDGRFAVVATGFGGCTVDLPGGLYGVNVESAAVPFTQTVILRPGTEKTVVYPGGAQEKLASPAPVPGSSSMHGYFRGPLKALSAPRQPGRLGARLVVMATRQARHEAATPIEFTGCQLWNSAGRRVASFSDVKQGRPDHLWAGTSTDLAPGGYVLEWPAPADCLQPCVRQPIWLSRGWCLLIFISVSAGERCPDPSMMSIHCSRLGESFASEDDGGSIDDPVAHEQRLLELALHSLADRHLLLPLEENGWLLHGKFENPMLGLTGAYLLLGCPEEKRAELEAVLKRLETLLPDHPDVTALRILAGGKAQPVQWPPMFRAGYAAVRDADWKIPGTIPQGSLADYVRARVDSGGVWTRWLEKKGVAPQPAAQAKTAAAKAHAHTPFAAPPAARKGADAPRTDRKGSSASARGITAKSKTSTHKAQPAKTGFHPVKAVSGTAKAKGGSAVWAKTSFSSTLAKTLTTVDQSVADQIQRFVEQVQATGRRWLKAADLRWTGLSSAQVSTVLNLLNSSAKNPAKPKGIAVKLAKSKVARAHSASPSVPSRRKGAA